MATAAGVGSERGGEDLGAYHQGWFEEAFAQQVLILISCAGFIDVALVATERRSLG